VETVGCTYHRLGVAALTMTIGGHYSRYRWLNNHKQE
jgi:hypothetical protein